MKIKSYILIGIIIIAIIIAGYFINQNNTSTSTTKDARLTQPTQNSVPAQQKPRDNATEINCDNLENEINSMLDEVNHCDSDDDCAFESRYYCPFGCNQFFNKKADLTKIDQKVKIFRDNKCNLCEYGCMTPPEANDIKCINNKCVDKRYQN